MPARGSRSGGILWGVQAVCRVGCGHCGAGSRCAVGVWALGVGSWPRVGGQALLQACIMGRVGVWGASTVRGPGCKRRGGACEGAACVVGGGMRGRVGSTGAVGGAWQGMGAIAGNSWGRGHGAGMRAPWTGCRRGGGRGCGGPQVPQGRGAAGGRLSSARVRGRHEDQTRAASPHEAAQRHQGVRVQGVPPQVRAEGQHAEALQAAHG